MAAVRSNNLNVGGGSINRAGDMLLVHGVGRTNTIEQLQDIVVTAKEGVPIRVRDVAEVTIGHEIRRGAVTATSRNPDDPERLDQGEVVLGLGFMLMGELVEFGKTTDIFTRPKDKRTEDYITGRFG